MQRYTVSLSGGSHDAEGHTRDLQQDSSAGSAGAASSIEADGNAPMPAQQEQTAPALPGASDTEVGIEDSDGKTWHTRLTGTLEKNLLQPSYRVYTAHISPGL